MQKQITSIPGYRVIEYLLVLEPHEELQTQIQSIKNEFARKYNAPFALHTKPHVALVKFNAFQMAQDRIVNRISNIALGIKPFKVELSGFGSFPSHTIYATIITKVPIQAVLKELKAATPLMTLNKEYKPHFIEESHIAVCRKLKPWQFEKGWLEYSHRHFTGRFIADSLHLLCRPEGEMKYEPVMCFKFGALAVNNKQGSLFM